MKPSQCDCSTARSAVDRRGFVKGLAAAAALVLPGRSLQAGLYSGPSRTSAAETAVTELYRTLTDDQKKVLCLPFDHEKRHRISANWHVTEPTLGQQNFFTSMQRELTTRIVRGLCSEEGYARLTRQMDEDAGGLHEFSVAFFGVPGDEAQPFEFMLTGRHLTLRADGNTVDRAAFGGPIIYGHDQVDPVASKNIYYYQTQQTDAVFRSLTADQAAKALVAQAPAETAVQLQGDAGKFAGIQVGELSAEQKQQVEQALKVLLAPYRTEDVSEVMDIVKSSGGMDQLHMAFYSQGDLSGDKTWDIWRVEGPSFVWHYRGAPHVHAYINIGTRKA
ncbi:MAG: DUF3500 domain-containing protein [Planctomyces sp.]|jgi:hypothetical protein